ncbi:MAG: class I SAM-dependent methyltransferase, partial [Myxococcota bacterium]
LRRTILHAKPFLRRLYSEWYEELRAAVPDGDGRVLELGSGGGFLGEFLPNAIRSDVFPVPGLSVVLDGRALPFRDASLRAIVMTEVLHHIPDPEAFLREASRCVRPGGSVAMVEPWVTPWARFVWGRLHHEPFEPAAASWRIPESGPLSGANGALPWILFERDRGRFEERLPDWEIVSIRLDLPFRYLVSGGVSLRSLMPGRSFALWTWLERRLAPWMETIGTMATIVLRRRGQA